MCALVSNVHHPLGGCSKAQYRSQQNTASASNFGGASANPPAAHSLSRAPAGSLQLKVGMCCCSTEAWSCSLLV